MILEIQKLTSHTTQGVYAGSMFATAFISISQHNNERPPRYMHSVAYEDCVRAL